MPPPDVNSIQRSNSMTNLESMLHLEPLENQNNANNQNDVGNQGNVDGRRQVVQQDPEVNNVVVNRYSPTTTMWLWAATGT